MLAVLHHPGESQADLPTQFLPVKRRKKGPQGAYPTRAFLVHVFEQLRVEVPVGGRVSEILAVGHTEP
jgi:hypothetical protein